MPYFKVTRILKETYEVKAGIREEALNDVTDPSTVTVVKTTCVRVKEKQ